MLRDHFADGGLHAHGPQFLQRFLSAFGGVVRLRWIASGTQYEVVHGFSDLFEVVERFDGSRDGLGAFPDDAIAIEEEDLHVSEQLCVAPGEEAGDLVGSGLHGKGGRNRNRGYLWK